MTTPTRNAQLRVQARASWRRFVWRLVAVSTVAGGCILGIGFARDNAVLTMLGAFWLSSAFWMAAWTVADV